MHLLITGGAGFIGSHTVLELLKAGFDVTVVDNFHNSVKGPKGTAVSLDRVSKLAGKPVPFVEADINDTAALDAVFANAKPGFDGVIHFAALKAVGESAVIPLEYYINNITGTLNLLSLCKKYNVKNFIFSSSATVYGTPSELPLKETSSTGVGITNTYGRTKYMVEQILVDLQAAEPDWNVILLRYFNPVGAHPSGEIGEDPNGVPNNLMPFVSQVAIGKLPIVRIFGDKFDTPDGTGVRDYIHVVDLAKGHVAAIQRIADAPGQKVGLEVYNLGTGNGYSVKEMIAALEKASGRTIPTEVTVPRLGDVACVYCDPALAAEKLGWQAENGLDEMCRDLWNWQAKNPNGFQSE